MKKILLFFSLLLLSFVTSAQDVSTIYTDRPNATDAAQLLDVGDFQVELGFFSDTNTQNKITDRTITQPNISLKYGLFKWAEIRVLTNYQTQINDLSGAKNRNSGITPITISPKFKLIDQDGFLSKLAVTTSFTLPNVGAKDFQNKKLNVGYRLLMNNTLSEKIGWSHSFGTDWDDNADTQWIYSSSFGFTLSDKLGAFTELYGTFNTTANAYYWDGGFTYLFLNNLTADAMLGVGLNNNASDYYLSVGVAWKTSFKH